MQSGKWWLTYINYLFASAIFFFLLMCCVADRYFALCSGCEGKPWHESWVVMHWWLVSIHLFILSDVTPYIYIYVMLLTFINFQVYFLIWIFGSSLDLFITLFCILQPMGKQQNLASLRMATCLNLQLVCQECENFASPLIHIWCLTDLFKI